MKRLLAITISLISLLQSGCYYDKQELLSPVSCDTTIVTYSGFVNPIIAASCTGCHSGVNAPLGIQLDIYTGINAQALNGKLLGAVTHSSGFSPMPKNGTKLSDCNIAKIRKWIDAGAPDN